MTIKIQDTLIPNGPFALVQAADVGGGLQVLTTWDGEEPIADFLDSQIPEAMRDTGMVVRVVNGLNTVDYERMGGLWKASGQQSLILNVVETGLSCGGMGTDTLTVDAGILIDGLGKRHLVPELELDSFSSDDNYVLYWQPSSGSITYIPLSIGSPVGTLPLAIFQVTLGLITKIVDIRPLVTTSPSVSIGGATFQGFYEALCYLASLFLKPRDSEIVVGPSPYMPSVAGTCIDLNTDVILSGGVVKSRLTGLRITGRPLATITANPNNTTFIDFAGLADVKISNLDFSLPSAANFTLFKNPGANFQLTRSTISSPTNKLECVIRYTSAVGDLGTTRLETVRTLANNFAGESSIVFIDNVAVSNLICVEACEFKYADHVVRVLGDPSSLAVSFRDSKFELMKESGGVYSQDTDDNPASLTFDGCVCVTGQDGGAGTNYSLVQANDVIAALVTNLTVTGWGGEKRVRLDNGRYSNCQSVAGGQVELGLRTTLDNCVFTAVVGTEYCPQSAVNCSFTFKPGAYFAYLSTLGITSFNFTGCKFVRDSDPVASDAYSVIVNTQNDVEVILQNCDIILATKPASVSGGKTLIQAPGGLHMSHCRVDAGAWTDNTDTWLVQVTHGALTMEHNSLTFVGGGINHAEGLNANLTGNKWTQKCRATTHSNLLGPVGSVCHVVDNDMDFSASTANADASLNFLTRNQKTILFHGNRVKGHANTVGVAIDSASFLNMTGNEIADIYKSLDVIFNTPRQAIIVGNRLEAANISGTGTIVNDNNIIFT